MEIICNKCWQGVQEKAYRIPCQHVFCETCIHHQFSSKLKCPVCSFAAKSLNSVREFQVVGGPIPDNQLESLEDMVVSVYVANGHRWLADQLEGLHKFELLQMQARIRFQEVEQERTAQKWQKREEDLMAQQIQAQHIVDKLEHKVDQLQKSLSDLSIAKDKLHHQMEDKTRQMNNWKQMYEDMRVGDNRSPPPEITKRGDYSAQEEKRSKAIPARSGRNPQVEERQLFGRKGREGSFFGDQPFRSKPMDNLFNSVQNTKFTAAGSGYQSDSGAYTSTNSGPFSKNLFAKVRPRSSNRPSRSYGENPLPFKKPNMDSFAKRPPTSYGARGRSKGESRSHPKSPMSTGSRSSAGHLRDILSRTPSTQAQSRSRAAHGTYKRRHV